MAAGVHHPSGHSRTHLPTIALLIALLAASAGAAGTFARGGGGPGWRMIGHGDFGGMLWKLDAGTGQVIWSHHVSDYTGIAGDIARTSPSLAGDTLVVGDLRYPYMLGIDARTGSCVGVLRCTPIRKDHDRLSRSRRRHDPVEDKSCG